jgi:three-Cys-motif partner protein
MAAVRTVPWPRDPHTAAKHAVYDGYLKKWWPIMVRGFGGVATYCEGFAGPGVYSGREPGSPIIALRALLADRSLKDKVKGARLLFVDADPRCVHMLEKRLVDAVPPNWQPPQWRSVGIDLDVQHGECEPQLEQVLDRHQAWGHPILAVFDTWGGAVSARLVKRIADNASSEVIVTIQPQYFARFAEVQDIEHGDKVFGSTSWREVARQPSHQKISWLLNHYRKTIEISGFRFVLDFELADESGHLLYLVFGTSHKRGLQKMKEAMWEVDDIYGTGYRDPRDPDQETLQIQFEPQTATLRRLILAHLATLPDQQATMNELREFALYQTVYKESQARSVVLEMVAEGLLHTDGDRRVGLASVVRLPV